MRNTLVYSAALTCLLLALQSCTKKSQDDLVLASKPNQVIHISVSSGQSYIFTPGYPGTLDVSRQASHYQISQAGVDENGFPIYKYNSLSGYSGPDQVTLSLYTKSASSGSTSGCPEHPAGSDASNSTTSSSTIAIQIDVTK